MRTTPKTLGASALGLSLRLAAVVIAGVPFLHTVGTVLASEEKPAHGKDGSHSVVAHDERDPAHAPLHGYAAASDGHHPSPPHATLESGHEQHDPHLPHEKKHIEAIGVRGGRGREEDGGSPSDEARTVMEVLRVGHLTGDEEAWAIHGHQHAQSGPPNQGTDDERADHTAVVENRQTTPPGAMPWMLQAMNRHGIRNVVVGDLSADQLTVVVPHTSARAIHSMASALGGTVTQQPRSDAGRTQGLTISTPYGTAQVYYAMNGRTFRQLGNDDASRHVRLATEHGFMDQRVLMDPSIVLQGARSTDSSYLQAPAGRGGLEGLHLSVVDSSAMQR